MWNLLPWRLPHASVICRQFVFPGNCVKTRPVITLHQSKTFISHCLGCLKWSAIRATSLRTHCSLWIPERFAYYVPTRTFCSFVGVDAMRPLRPHAPWRLGPMTVCSFRFRFLHKDCIGFCHWNNRRDYDRPVVHFNGNYKNTWSFCVL